ncbi:hypothetical protein JXL19_02045 [bacterium]|nr:hypothetical protein [bacterium]
MNRIRVECLDLIEAFESNSPGLTYFLNRESGEVEKVPDEFCPDETVSGIDYFSDPRYIRIPSISDDKGLWIRKEYLSCIQDEDLHDKLEHILTGRGSLKRFVDVLRAYPEFYCDWEGFKNRELLKTIMAWSEELDIEIDLVNMPVKKDQKDT